MPRQVQTVGGEPHQARVAADVLRHHGRGAQGAFSVAGCRRGASTGSSCRCRRFWWESWALSEPASPEQSSSTEQSSAGQSSAKQSSVGQRSSEQSGSNQRSEAEARLSLFRVCCFLHLLGGAATAVAVFSSVPFVFEGGETRCCCFCCAVWLVFALNLAEQVGTVIAGIALICEGRQAKLFMDGILKLFMDGISAFMMHGCQRRVFISACTIHVHFCTTSGVRVGPTLAAHCDKVLLDDLAALLSPAPAFTEGACMSYTALPHALPLCHGISRHLVLPRRLQQAGQRKFLWVQQRFFLYGQNC